MSAGAAAAAANVTQDDVQQYMAQDVNQFQESCSKGLTEHYFGPVTAGLTIGNHIMTEIVNKCTAATQPGQVTSGHRDRCRRRGCRCYRYRG